MENYDKSSSKRIIQGVVVVYRLNCNKEEDVFDFSKKKSNNIHSNRIHKEEKRELREEVEDKQRRLENCVIRREKRFQPSSEKMSEKEKMGGER